MQIWGGGFLYINDLYQKWGDLTWLWLLQLLRQLGHLFKQISHEPHIRDLKDRCVGVLVDRRDDLAVLHAREMLDRAGNARAQIELRCDVFARLADLQAVVCKPAVHRCSRRPDGCPQSVRQRRDQLIELLLRLQTAAA